MLDRKLSLVLPAHNEAENIGAVVERAACILPSVVSDYEIVVVDDGSRDGTGVIADELAKHNPHLRVIHHPVNQGYGAALTSGFRAATGDLIMFMDADRQFDIADVAALAPYLPHYEIVAGYRIDRQDALHRKLFAKLFGLAIRMLFGLKLRDLDCAFKIFKADLIRNVELTTPGALINTELLVRAREQGARVVEVGVRHYPRYAGESSGGSPKVVIRAMGETVRLWFRFRREALGARKASSVARVLSAPLVLLLALLGSVLLWLNRRKGS